MLETADAPRTSPGFLKSLNLLTSKPVLYVCNVAEATAGTGNAHVAAVAEMAPHRAPHRGHLGGHRGGNRPARGGGSGEFLEAMGLEEPGLDRLIREGYDLLEPDHLLHRRPEGNPRLDGHQGHQGPRAAGVIHTDFERASSAPRPLPMTTTSALGGENAAKEAGKARDEGKEYVVKDGDVLLFKFNT
jgi:ribosome-binding ATPase YchF (GTP1/OBG family)